MQIILLCGDVEILKAFYDRRCASVFKVDTIVRVECTIRTRIEFLHILQVFRAEIGNVMIPMGTGVRNPLTAGHELILNVPTERVTHTAVAAS